jgi:hypothetical protein
MRCKATDAPQCEHCKRWATPQRARYDQKNCATYFCAVPYSWRLPGTNRIATTCLEAGTYHTGMHAHLVSAVLSFSPFGFPVMQIRISNFLICINNVSYRTVRILTTWWTAERFSWALNTGTDSTSRSCRSVSTLLSPSQCEQGDPGKGARNAKSTRSEGRGIPRSRVQ